MSNKIIGVTPRINKTETNTFLRVHRNYIDRLIQNGLTPIIITPNSNLDCVMPLCSGFLIIGGDDFDPIMYGENNDLNLSKEIEPEMDELDHIIINYAMSHHVPLLGICRGHQALAAVLGKKLYQDIDYCHLSHPHDGIYHEVTKITNYGLATKLPEKFISNTYHHQAINEVPDGFVVLFQNHDVIEAIEHTSLPIIGIQWHPERMETAESKVIFDYFYQKVCEYEQNN